MTKRLLAVALALLIAVPAFAQRPTAPMISGATSTGESKTLLVTTAGAVVLSTGSTAGLQRPVSQMVAGAASDGTANITLLVDSDGALVVSGGTGTFTGSLAATQVAFGTGADEIGGEAAFTYNSTTNTLASDIVTVADSAYGAGWNGSLAVPTRNAVYDKIETLVTAGTGANTQCAYWTSATTIAGDADCTFATDTLTVTKIIGSTSITNSALTSTRVVFSGASGVQSDDAGMTYVAATDTLTTGAGVFANAGAASLPMVSVTGATFTGGSATTTKPSVLIEPTGATSTNWPTTGTLLGINAASGSTANLVNAQLNGVDRFSISSGGVTVIDSTSAVPFYVRRTSAPGSFMAIQDSASGTGTTDGLQAQHQSANSWIWNYENGFLKFGTNNTERWVIASGGNFTGLTGSNIGIGTATFGTSAANVLALLNGTVPSTSPADTLQIFSCDISAGNASLCLRTETAVAADVATASTNSLSVTINGTIYKILLATP